MFKYNTPQKWKKIMKRAQIGGAHLQYVNNHLAKFEWKGIKTFGETDYTNLVPLKSCGRTDGQSGPITRPAFAKATQVKIFKVI